MGGGFIQSYLYDSDVQSFNDCKMTAYQNSKINILHSTTKSFNKTFKTDLVSILNLVIQKQL